MIALRLPEVNGSLQILCLGCHSDDIEIGCGGTILRLAAAVSGLRDPLGGVQRQGQCGTEEARLGGEAVRR